MASHSHSSGADGFERDIEDAIFETIDVGLDKPIYVNPSKPAQPVPPLITPLMTPVMTPPVMGIKSNKTGLSVFSSDPCMSSKPVISQALLTTAVFIFTIALVLPGIWFVHSAIGPKETIDRQLTTGSTPEASAAPSASQSPVDDPILMKPNNAIHVNNSASSQSEYGAGTGSIVYFGSK